MTIRNTRELPITACEHMSWRKLIQKQTDGATEYGHGIDYMDSYDWIEECIEELADGLQYAVAAKMRLSNQIYILDCIIDDIKGMYSYEVDLCEKLDEISDLFEHDRKRI